MAKGGRRSTSWRKGKSGNLFGRPKRPATVEARKIIADVKAAAREMTPKALATLEQVMDDPKAPPAARVGAATAVLDRAWGRPTQSIEEMLNRSPSLIWSLCRWRTVRPKPARSPRAS